MPDTPPTFKIRLLRVAGVLLAIVLALALLEGLASLGLFAFDVALEGSGPIPERTHTRHDPELGWVHVPGSRAPDLYGPGLDVTINSQGFRDAGDFPARVPPGKTRVVASGDSFTFGFGVDDGESWPARLEELDERLEVVNMAQPGYGLDQIYLWYLRDASALEHQVHVLAVVIDDVWRMRGDNFLGYGKPLLKLEDGELTADAVPVPSRSYLWPWMTQNVGLVRRLRLAQLFLRLLPSEPPATLSDAETWRLAAAAVESLSRRHRDEGRAFLFVYLPTVQDYRPSPLDGQRRGFLARLERQGVPVLDLVPAMRERPPANVGELFIRPGESDYGGAVGHYSAAGNRWVAERVHAWISERKDVFS